MPILARAERDVTTRSIATTHAFRSTVVPAAAYLLLAVVLFGRTWLGGGLGSRWVGYPGDPWGYVWGLAWLPHAIGAGHWPFFTSEAMAPQGANILTNASVPLPALLLAPVTIAFGATVSYDVLATLGVALTAWVCFLGLGRLGVRRGAAFVGGLVYGFGGFFTGQSLSHGALLVGVLPPLLVILLDDIRRRRRPALKAVLAGLACAAQLLVQEEVLALTVLMACWLALVWAVVQRPAVTELRTYATYAAIGVGIFVVLAAPLLAYQMLGPEHINGTLVSTARYANDLESFLVPNQTQAFATAGMLRTAGALTGFDGEHGGYLGPLFIVVLAFAVWRLRRRALYPAAILVAAVIASLGARLWINGHETSLPLPWAAFTRLPLLDNVFPDRFNLFVWLAAGVLVALLVDDLRRATAGRQALGLLLVAAGLVTIVPKPVQSSAFASPRFASMLGAHGRGTVLIAPLVAGQLAMYTQVGDHFAYSIPQGGLYVPGGAQAAVGMRYGPLKYALQRLEGQSGADAGETRLDAHCVRFVTRPPALPTACLSLYRRALRDLHATHVAVVAYGAPSIVSANTRFFGRLLGRATSHAGKSLIFSTKAPPVSS